MGIELYPKFLSPTETRCYQSLPESIVAKCCRDLSDDPSCRACHQCEHNRLGTGPAFPVTGLQEVEYGC